MGPTRTGAAFVAAASVLLPALAGAGAPGGGPGPAEGARWRLASGQLAEYALVPVTVDAKTGERKKGAERSHGVFGHRIEGGRFPRPLSPSLKDLALVYALSLPPEPRAGEERTLYERLADCGPVEAAAKWTATPRADGGLDLRAEVDLRHRGPMKSDDFDRVLVDGRITVASVFDPARGVVASSTYSMEARTIADAGAVKDRRAAEVRPAGELEFRRVRDAKDPEFQRSVDGAIAKGVAWLAKQPKEGAFPPYDGYPGGSDGLAALALHACDEERKGGDAALAKAMSFDPTKTYQAAVTMLAIDMHRTPPGEAALLRAGRVAKPLRNLDEAERAWMAKGAEFLLKSAVGPGRWNYPSAQHGGRFVPPPPDLSNSQYAVLGLLAAHRCGVEIEEGAWLGILRSFTQAQEKDGPPVPGWFPSARQQREAESAATLGAPPTGRSRGFPYRTGEASSGTMTCAGIASIAIARDVLREKGKEVPPQLALAAERAILDGFGWIHANYTVQQAPHADGRPRKWLHYYLYALERAGILADVARVNEHDWYGEGALWLLLTQDGDGWWTEETGSAPRKVADTCFALLFLKRAVTPVATR